MNPNRPLVRPSHRLASHRVAALASALALSLCALTAQAADPNSYSIGILSSGGGMPGGAKCISSSGNAEVGTDEALCNGGDGVGLVSYDSVGGWGAYAITSNPSFLRFGAGGADRMTISPSLISAKVRMDMSNNKISGLATGTIGAGGSEAVNGGQIYGISTSLRDIFGGTTTVNATTGALTAPSFTLARANEIAGTTGAATTVTAGFDKVDAALNKLSLSSSLVKQDTTTNDVTVAAATGGTLVNFTGTDGERVLTGVGAGEVSSSSLDAINGTQLHGTANSVATAIGGGASVDADGKVTGTSFALGNANSINGTTGAATTITDALDKVDTALGSINDDVADLDDRVTTVEGDITNLTNGTAGMVQQAAAGEKLTVGKNTDGTEVDFTGTGGTRKLSGISDGNIAANSKEAVNGGQLYVSDQRVQQQGNTTASSLGGDASYNTTTGVITGPSYAVSKANTINGTTGAATTVGDALDKVDTALGALNDNVTDLDDRVTSNEDDIADLDSRVTTVEGDITNLTNGTAGMVQQAAAGEKLTVGKDTDGTEVDFTGTAGTRKLSGVSDGNIAANSKEAVNGGQLYITDQRVLQQGTTTATLLGGGASYNATTGVLTAPSYALSKANTINGTTDAAGNVGDALDKVDTALGALADQATDLDDRVTDVEDEIDDIANGKAGLVQQAAPGAKLTVGKDTDGTEVDFADKNGAARKLSNVADGTVAAGSKDAVNGGQLYGVSSSVSTALGGGSTVNADGTVSAPAYSIGGQTYNNVGGALSNLDGRTTQNTTDIANLSNNINNGSIGLVKQDATTRDITVAKDTDGKVVNMAGTAGTRTVTGVSAGAINATSVDAVNGSQLHGLASSTSNAFGGGSVVNEDGTVSAPSYSVGGQTVNNVGDAVSNLDGRTTQNTSDINTLRNEVNKSPAGLVKQDATTQQVTVAANTGGTEINVAGTEGPRRLTGVERGIGNSDAVNMGQFNEQINRLDSRIDDAWNGLNRDLDEYNRQSNRGIAAASALINVTPYVPGHVAVNAGIATYRGETALGIGVSRWSQDGRLNVNGGISAAHGDKPVVRVGVGIVF